MKTLSPMAMVAVAASISIAALASDVTNAVASAKSPRKRVMRRDADKIEEASPSTTVVATPQPAEPATPTSATVADVFAVELAKASSAAVPDIVAAALAKASEAQVPAILAALEAKLSTMAVKDVQRVLEIALRDKWYDRFVAVPGSKLYWILKIAKERAANGKNVDDLERAFFSSLKAWAKEEE